MDAGRGVDSGDAKGVVQRVRKVGNFHMFAATVSRDRDVAQRRLGILGPILRGAVGDTIKVVFKNNGMHPFSMHRHAPEISGGAQC